jgi:hypothetical protein
MLLTLLTYLKKSGSLESGRLEGQVRKVILHERIDLFHHFKFCINNNKILDFYILHTYIWYMYILIQLCHSRNKASNTSILSLILNSSHGA